MGWLRLLGGLAVLGTVVLTLGSVVTAAGSLTGDPASLAVLGLVGLLVLALAGYGNRFDRGSAYW